MNCDLSRMYGIRYYSPTPSTNRPTSFSSSRETINSPCSSLTDSPTPSSSICCGPLTVFSFISEAKTTTDLPRLSPVDPATAARDSPHFRDGLLLNSREKSVLIPAVHISDSGDYLGTPRTQSVALGETVNLGKDYVVTQGVYQEVRKIVPETELPRVAPIPQEQRNIGYMVIGFKSIDRNFSQVMLDTWKDWTGARYIYMYLPDDLGLRRISLYHRQAPDDLNLFMYVVVVECHGITSPEKEIRLIDFAQRMRLERLTGFISVYTGTRSDSRLQSPAGDSITFHLNHLNAVVDGFHHVKDDKADISESLVPNGVIRTNSRM